MNQSERWLIVLGVTLLLAISIYTINKPPMQTEESGSQEQIVAAQNEYAQILEETKKLNEEKGIELTPYQYYITQKDGTEKAFENEYWNNKEPGIYVDVVTGEPLFSSLDKYDSGTGWPSFTKPLDEEKIVEKEDNKLAVPRTEVESKDGTHLGHVFNDGPQEEGGLRFCINSASLKFIHKDDLEKEGYGEYLQLFEEN